MATLNFLICRGPFLLRRRTLQDRFDTYDQTVVSNANIAVKKNANENW